MEGRQNDLVDARLAGRIWRHRAGKTVADSRRVEQRAERINDESTHIGPCAENLVDPFGAAVDECDDVAEVAAAEQAPFPRGLNASSFVASR